MSINEKVLFIGYKYNYPKTIRETMKLSEIDCDYLFLDQNIDLYNPSYSRINNDCDPVFKMIKEQVENHKYKSFIVDIPNLALPTNDYSNSKKLLKYLKSKKKKMLILNSGSVSKFNRIFGKPYSDMIMNESYVIRCGHHELIRKQIRSMVL